MEDKKFKCDYCKKEFAREVNKKMHEEVYCSSNPNSEKFVGIKELKKYEKEFEETKKEVIEDKYTDDERFVIDYFSGKSLSEISIPQGDKQKIYDVYVALIGKSFNKDCNFQMISAYTTLWYRRSLILKRK